MTKAKIWFLAITTALGGFLFGIPSISEMAAYGAALRHLC